MLRYCVATEIWVQSGIAFYIFLISDKHVIKNYLLELKKIHWAIIKILIEF